VTRSFGTAAADAAWLVLQHGVSDPPVIRRGLALFHATGADVVGPGATGYLENRERVHTGNGGHSPSTTPDVRDTQDGGPFHAGELSVQERAGVRASAERVARIIGPTIPPAAAGFLGAVRTVAAGAADDAGRVWATLLVGPPGFLEPTPERLHVAARPVVGDALRAVLTPAKRYGGARPRLHRLPPVAPVPVGLTAIDLASRRRMRVNGTLAADDRGDRPGFAVAVEEAYGNCPKYIQARTLLPASATAPGAADVPGDTDRSTRVALSDAQRAWLREADTAFVASVGPATGEAHGRADASHRGGAPGFLAAVGARQVLLPDYAGNSMFNTLGNLAADPRVGLAVPDFATGRLLQLSGTAAVDWRAEVAATFPGAERLVVIHVEHVREVAGALPAGWSAPEPSPFNPRPPRPGARG
jgi:hypothetical protein